MRALRYLGDDQVSLVDIEAPEPAPDEALVRVVATAICGSERHALRSGHATNVGHEAAGFIESAPADSGFAVGELVGISAVVGCDRCRACVVGREMLCEMGVLGPSRAGTPST